MKKPKLVVLSGAGVSAESGVKTFRDHDGLWENHRVEDVATPGAWRRNRALVQRFYNERRQQCKSVEPNAAHLGIAGLEKDFDVSVITQNVDDLHERAGSSMVLHLHGSLFLMRSDRQPHQDALAVPVHDDITDDHIAPDGGHYRPHIVWFEEEVPAIEEAVEITRQADVFVVVGTSLQVYPAAGLVDFVRPGVPVYILDKRIPDLAGSKDIVAIEEPATTGIETLKSYLTIYLKNHG